MRALIHVYPLFIFALSMSCSQDQTFKNDLRNSLDTLSRAQSHLEWETSEFHPIQVFRKYEKVGFRSEDGYDLCRRLQELSDADLSVFAEAISGRGNQLELKCRSALEDRLGRYAEQMEKAMESRLASAAALSPTPPPAVDIQIRMVDPTVDQVISNADLKPGQFALTFDDGPHRSLTPKLLKILEKYGILATFFVVGQNAERLPNLVRGTYDAGHSLGSHSWSHAHLPTLKREAAVMEIDSAQHLVSEIVGLPISFFRFPYGGWSTLLLSHLIANNWTSFLWNVDSTDWKLRNPDVLLAKVLADLQTAKRGVVLFHDIQPQTIAIIPNLLHEMAKRKYQVVVLWPKGRPLPSRRVLP